jgi:voltage-gated potassium channel
MSKTIYLFIASGLIILLGTFVMYGVESQVPNSKIKTILDALWWCVATVTTVGYGDIVPISNIGRIVALFYMFFGISMLAILMSVITNTFYKRRFEKEERKKRRTIELPQESINGKTFGHRTETGKMYRPY